MRFIALALILASLPIFVAMLRAYPQRRGWALAAMIFMIFLGTGALRINASIVGWPLWAGVVRGIEITPIDTLAIAMLLTRSNKSFRIPMFGVLLFYGLTIVLSIFQSTVPLATLFLIWQYVRVLVIFLAIANEVKFESMRRGLLTGISLGLMLEAAFVVAQKAQGVVQAGGTIGHQNTLGMMVELAILPLLAALMIGDRRTLVKIGALAGFVVIAAGGSRGTMGIGGTGIILFIIGTLALRPTPLKAKVAALGVLVMLMAVPLAIKTLNTRFAGGSFITQESERAAFERAARAMSADHPFGVGGNMYVATANTGGYSQRAGVTWWHASRAAPVHNGYLLARAETGWIGEFALIAILAFALMRGVQAAVKQRRTPAGDIALASAIAIGVNIVHNTFEFAVHSYHVQVLLVMNMALIVATLKDSSPQRRNVPKVYRSPNSNSPVPALHEA